MSKKSILDNNALLTELRIEFAAMKERFKVYSEMNTNDHVEMKKEITEISKTAGDEMREVEKRLRKLEDKDLQLSTTWKVGIGLATSLPLIIEVLRVFKILP